jgi:hypothetical protein
MKRITLTFPDRLYDEISAAAVSNTRSFSGEVMHRLDPMVGFPAPPKGKEWHNYLGLTAAQAEISKGWRLCLKDEVCNNKDDQFFKLETGKWCPEGIVDDESTYGRFPTTYRTKAPLPK